MIQEQKDVLVKLTKDHEAAKIQAEKDLEEMRSKLQEEKEEGEINVIWSMEKITLSRIRLYSYFFIHLLKFYSWSHSCSLDQFTFVMDVHKLKCNIFDIAWSASELLETLSAMIDCKNGMGEMSMN